MFKLLVFEVMVIKFLFLFQLSNKKKLLFWFHFGTTFLASKSHKDFCSLRPQTAYEIPRD